MRRRVVLDMDSPVPSEAEGTEIPVYGEQERSAYNGHFECSCYHPLLLFNRQGDCLAAKLRPGNVHSAEGWEELLLPEIERQRRRGREVAFRADAAFAKRELYEALEERQVKYAIRLPANNILEHNIAALLRRPPGRPGYGPLVRHQSFFYRAASWKRARRVVAKVEFYFGDLFPRVGFIVTNLVAGGRAVVRFYNKRGTAEQWIKEGRQAAALTRLSCHRFRANQVRLLLSVIAYNLGNPSTALRAPPVAAAGPADEDRALVAGQPSAACLRHARRGGQAPGEDRRAVGQACALLPAAVDRESPDAAPVCRDAAENRGLAGASGVGWGVGSFKIERRRDRRCRGVCGNRPAGGSDPDLRAAKPQS